MNEEIKEQLEETAAPVTNTPDSNEAPATAEPSAKEKKTKVKKGWKRELLEWVLTILAAVAIALVIRTFLFEPVRVDGHSMDNTLADGEIMFTTKLDYWLGNLDRFDVVICRYPGRGNTNFVKRIIGMPGDTVSLQNGYLTVNDVKYEEEYIDDSYRTGYLNTVGPYTVPKKGDVIECKNGVITLNGTEIDKSLVYGCVERQGLDSNLGAIAGKTRVAIAYGALYINAEKSTADCSYTVTEDCYFVMGDHRNNSNDSRSQGPITRSMIKGHVQCVLFPFSKIRSVE